MAPLPAAGGCQERWALVIVDVQNDFCSGGSLAVPDGDAVVPVINALRATRAWDAVVRTRDWHPANHCSFHANNPGTALFEEIVLPKTAVAQVMWPTHCVQGSHGAEYRDGLEVGAADVEVLKGQDPDVDSYSGFGTPPEETGLAGELARRGVTHVACCGLATDYCVGSTARDAAKHGFQTYLVLDASRGIADDTVGKMRASCEVAGVRFIASGADLPGPRAKEGHLGAR